MALTRDQLNRIIEILVPYFNTSDDDRRALIQRAFFSERIVDQLTYSGQAVTFAMNCVLHLKAYNTESAVVQLLKTVRDYYVGAEIQRQIDVLIVEIEGTATPSAATLLTTSPIPTLDAPLFISYSRKDVDFVNRLRSDFKAKGIPYWIDQEGLSPGTPNWERAIRAAIQTCSAVLWIVSPSAYESDYVASELAVAEMYKRRIYPVWSNGDNWVACVPLGKHNIQFVDMRGGLYLDGLQRLLTALGSVDSEFIIPPDEPPAPIPEPRNPYRGLTAFTQDDVGDFFGRESLIASLIQRLQKQLADGKARFLAVMGPSGAGKSSVVMAGVLPALEKREAITGSNHWRYLPTMTPGTHPMEKLAQTFTALMPSTEVNTVLTRLYMLGMEYLNIAFEMLPTERVVLYIDQFEELFTLTEDDVERQAFIGLLAGAVNEPNGKLIVLLSMRADFLDYPLNYPQLGVLFDKHSALVQPMSIPELRDAILKPAQQPDVGLTFDEGLVGDIVFELRGQDKALAGALPLLQFTLERLFEERDGGLLTREAYLRMGGVSGAISTHSETVFRSLPKTVQSKLGSVFLPLVNIDEETGEPTRRRAALEALIADRDAKRLVDAFVDNGLLQRGRDGDYRYLEVTHEALLRSWNTLVEWIATTRNDLRDIRQVEREAVTWDKQGRQYLLTVERLKAIHKVMERLGYTPTPVVHDFIYPQAMLLKELENPNTTEQRRLRIGDDLALLGDTREGVGVKDGIPDIVWLPVDGTNGKPYGFEFGSFEVKPFYVAQYQVTYAQYQAFFEAEDGFNNLEWWKDFPREYRPQRLSNARNTNVNNPRDSVSWYQSVAFTNWLNAKYRQTGMLAQFLVMNNLALGDESKWQIRLPTEWEWQWMAMNSTKKDNQPWGAWQRGCANTSESGLGRAIAVGMYPHGRAACGAFDVVGNLFEWCLNDYKNPTTIDGYGNGERKVLRGGSFFYFQFIASASFRNFYDPAYVYYLYGFRMVLSAPIASLISE